MSHPYLKLTYSDTYPNKYVVGKTARAQPFGDALTDTSVRNVVIPPSFNGIEIAEIGHISFYFSYITSIFIPKTILHICNEAFNACGSLTTVIFEEGSNIQSIERCVFYQCISLKKIDFPASLSLIPDASYFFSGVSLDCFSYAGTNDFSSLKSNFFKTVKKVYVPNDYKGSTFAGQNIIRGNIACGVSWNLLINETPIKSIHKSFIQRLNILQQECIFFLAYS